MQKEFKVTPWEVGGEIDYIKFNFNNDPLLHQDFFIKKYNMVNLYRLVSSYSNNVTNLTPHYKLSKNCKKFIIDSLKKQFHNMDVAALVLLKSLELYRNKKYSSRIKEKWRVKHNIQEGNITLEYARVLSIILSQNVKDSIQLFNALLIKSNYLISRGKRIRFPIKIKDLNDELAYLAGIISGDGHITKKLDEVIIADGTGKNEFLAGSKQFMQNIKTLIKKNFNLDSTIKYKKNYYTLRCNSSLICRIMNCIYQIPSGNKCSKIRVPSLIKGGLKENLFWRGMFDTDGYLRTKNKAISMTTKSNFIKKDFINFCRKNNIVIFHNKEKSNFKMLIAEQSILNFAKFIGISHPRKQKMLIYYLKKGAFYKVPQNKKQNNRLDKIINYLRPYDNKVYIKLTDIRGKSHPKEIKKRVKKIKKVLNMEIIEIKRNRRSNHYYLCSKKLVGVLNKYYKFVPSWAPLMQENIFALKNTWRLP